MTHQKNDRQDETESQESEDRDVARALTASGTDSLNQRAGGGSGFLPWHRAL